MLKRLWPALIAGGWALSGMAAAAGTDGEATAAVRKAVASLGPDVHIDVIAPAPLAGFYQVIAAGHLLYVSSDGKYMMNGNLIDLTARRNVSEDAWATFRKAELAKLPAGQGILFAPEHPRYTVTVFTDVNCEYCRVFHAHIDEYNRRGIAVNYLAWPREGITTTAGRETPTYAEMVAVWCAADRKAAFTAATQGHPSKPVHCDNPVKAQYELGERLGVDGTPAVIGPDGRMLGGFLPPDALLQALKESGPGG